jgi:hypothetical protein
MTLLVKTPYQEGLTRPTSPSDANGIAHGRSDDTKADRITAKLGWADYVADFKAGVTTGPFPDAGEIIYADDAVSPVITTDLIINLNASDTDSYPGAGAMWTNLVDSTEYTIRNGTFDSGDGGSIVFNGTSTFVDIGTPLSNGTNFTKEAWVNANVVTSARNILSSASNVFWNNGSTLSGGVGGQFSLVTSTNFPASVWRHVVLTFDDANNTMRLYINGTQVSQNTEVTQSYVSEIERIGAHFFSGNPVSFWNGKIAEVRVYSEALAAEDVLTNYDNTKTRFGL